MSSRGLLWPGHGAAVPHLLWQPRLPLPRRPPAAPRPVLPVDRQGQRQDRDPPAHRTPGQACTRNGSPTTGGSALSSVRCAKSRPRPTNCSCENVFEDSRSGPGMRLGATPCGLSLCSRARSLPGCSSAAWPAGSVSLCGRRGRRRRYVQPAVPATGSHGCKGGWDSSCRLADLTCGFWIRRKASQSPSVRSSTGRVGNALIPTFPRPQRFMNDGQQLQRCHSLGITCHIAP